MKNILIGCERSGIVREAFRAFGHNAISCDLEPCEDGRVDYHYIGDVRTALQMQRWDMFLCYPPCTYLSSSGLHWNHRRSGRDAKTEQAVKFVADLWQLAEDEGVELIAFENPIGRLSTAWRKWTQIIQPYMFGEDASKRTCLWLKNLPPLRSTKRINGRIVTTASGRRVERWANQTDSGQNKLPPSASRAVDRARTYPGIAMAKAEQWSTCV